LTGDELRQLLRTAAGHRFFPICWLTAMTGMRRNEVLGLKWSDIDVKKKRLHLNRCLVAVGYEVHQTRGKTKTARRSIDFDQTTLDVLEGWRAFQAAEFAAVGIDNSDEWVFTDGDGEPVTPTPSTRRSGGSCTTPACRGSGSTTCATPTGACSSKKASR
jgi:integrase